MGKILKVPIDWPVELNVRRGSPKRLLGVTVYYDFRWLEIFLDQRTQFKNGLSLARLAISECPHGKKPALLLTVLGDAVESSIETDDEYVLVVRIHSYLVSQGNDPAASYFAHQLHHGIPQMSQFQALADSPSLMAAFLDQHLTTPLVRDWAFADASRVDALEALGLKTDALAELSPRQVLAAIGNIVNLGPSVWNFVLNGFPSLLDSESREALLSAITGDRDGRIAVGESIGARLVERIDDARRAAQDFSRLLDSATTTETDLQSFIQRHPWLVGLDYLAIRAKHDVPRGQLDFILERFDGFHDLLELKSPTDPIVTAPAAVNGVPPSPSRFALSPGLANALAQIHVYRDILTADENTVERRYGLQNSRHPRLIVLIGQARRLDDHCARVLHQLNLSLHGVEIVPFDLVGRRADALLSTVERYLADPADTS